MLHIINKTNCVPRCLQSVQESDVILLIQDGVIAGVNNALPENITMNCYALAEDILARGLQDKINPKITQINYDQFVELTIKHHPILSWS